VLKAIAQSCENTIRGTDLLCRYGGEEFAIIAPETAGRDAMILANKIRASIALLHFEGVPVVVTISLGVVQIGGAVSSSDVAIAGADQALYSAKRLGRNRECLHSASATAVRSAAR
jgi:diguanylate cyclase (GGDEF)-like protein